MPVIACLGWGSLIWDPRELPMDSDWHTDGPAVPVEFLRRSSNGHITLVLDASAEPLPALWATLTSPDLASAAEALRQREGILPEYPQNVGRWQRGDEAPLIPDLPDWAEAKGVDAVVWTALRRKFHRPNRVATAQEIVAYLGGLTGEVREKAEKYVRRAPPQIATAYRRQIEENLSWKPPD